jgi:hypothetical protein
MRHALMVATLAALFGCTPAFAQVSGTGAASGSALGIGQTSPLGVMGSSPSVGPIGIPLGATEFQPGGISPVPSGTLLGTSCSATGSAASGMSGSTSTFDGGGATGTAMAGGAPSLGTCSMGLGSGSSDPTQTGASAAPSGGSGPGQLGGRSGIPMGATQLGSAGLSPTPTLSPTVAPLVASPPISVFGSLPTVATPSPTLPNSAIGNSVGCPTTGLSGRPGTSTPSIGC